MKGGHGLAVGKRQDGILLTMEIFLRLGDSLHDKNEQLRECCAEQTGVHRMYYGSIAFLSSYLRKRPDTYRHDDIHSTGLDHLASIQLNPQLSVYKRIPTITRSIRNGNDHTKVCVFIQKSQVGGLAKEHISNSGTVELFEVMKIFKQPFCNIT